MTKMVVVKMREVVVGDRVFVDNHMQEVTDIVAKEDIVNLWLGRSVRGDFDTRTIFIGHPMETICIAERPPEELVFMIVINDIAIYGCSLDQAKRAFNQFRRLNGVGLDDQYIDSILENEPHTVEWDMGKTKIFIIRQEVDDAEK